MEVGNGFSQDLFPLQQGHFPLRRLREEKKHLSVSDPAFTAPTQNQPAKPEGRWLDTMARAAVVDYILEGGMNKTECCIMKSKALLDLVLLVLQPKHEIFLNRNLFFFSRSLF